MAASAIIPETARKSSAAFIRPLVVIGLALGVLFARRPDAFLVPQFWAEDFTFLLAAEKPGLGALLEPQAGYLHTIPRIVAWTASPADPFLQPGIFLLGWLLTTFAVLFSCLSPRLDLAGKPWLALAILVVPHTGEVFFTLTNAQWLAALGLLLTFLKNDPTKVGAWLADIAFLFFAGLSGPFIIFSLPLFLIRAWQRRTLPSFILLGVAMIFAVIQGWFVSHAGPDNEFVGPFSLFNLFATVSYRLFCNLFFGAWVSGNASPGFCIALAATVMAFLCFAIYRARNHRLQLGVLLAFIILLLGVTTLRKRLDLWGWGDIGNGDRYFFVPKVALLWVTLVALKSQPASWIRRGLIALLVCGALSNLSRFQFEPQPDRRWYQLCPNIRAHREVEVNINPGWKFRYRRAHP